MLWVRNPNTTVIHLCLGGLVLLHVSHWYFCDQFGHQVTKHDHLVELELGHRLLMVRYQFGNQLNDFGHRFGQEQLLQASLKSAEMFLILAGRGARSLI